MKLPIYAYGHSVYRQVAEPVTPDTAELPALLRNMKETMWLLKCEVLAAQHVGRPLALFILDAGAEGKKVFLNAEVVSENGGIMAQMETDPSFPGLAMSIDRQSRLVLRYQDETFEPRTEEFASKHARFIFQMTDLAKGITPVQHLNPFRQRSVRPHLKAIEKGTHEGAADLVRE